MRVTFYVQANVQRSAVPWSAENTSHFRCWSNQSLFKFQHNGQHLSEMMRKKKVWSFFPQVPSYTWFSVSRFFVSSQRVGYYYLFVWWEFTGACSLPRSVVVPQLAARLNRSQTCVLGAGRGGRGDLTPGFWNFIFAVNFLVDICLSLNFGVGKRRLSPQFPPPWKTPLTPLHIRHRTQAA